MDCSLDVQHFIGQVQAEIEAIVKDNFIGSYIHGSLALGGHNDRVSDIDLIIVTKEALHLIDKHRLTKLFLTISNTPYPLEITFLYVYQLKTWQHPCPFDYHYSEYWRLFYQRATKDELEALFTNHHKMDRDLAAHITIINTHGICCKGEAIENVFPKVPKRDYIDAIISDFEDCLDIVYINPVYCILNTLRVYLVVKEDWITSKLEAGRWGVQHVPLPFQETIQLALAKYEGMETDDRFSHDELSSFIQYFKNEIVTYKAVFE